MNRLFPKVVLILAFSLGSASSLYAADPTSTKLTSEVMAWPSEPLTQQRCLDLAARGNPSLRKAREAINEALGSARETRSIYTPKLSASGSYTKDDDGKIETLSFEGSPGIRFRGDENWSSAIQLAQPFYAGGRLKSASRAARLTEEIALARYQLQLSDVLLEVRTTYSDALLSQEQIQVQEASIKLLERELADTKRRFEAGVVPKFNVLRAEVELANSQPRLIRARNAQRIAKNRLATVLGWNIPAEVGEEIPLSFADRLSPAPPSMDLAKALAAAKSQRPELTVLRTSEKLRQEDLIQAKAGNKPQLSGIAGYGWQNKIFTDHLDDYNHGWNVGVQMSWDVFDFGRTRGKIQAALARLEQSRIETDDTERHIELEVRTAVLQVREATEVLASQNKAIEQAEEAVRLVLARADAGTGTQLEVLSSQTALTEARTTLSVALRDLALALARLDRATGSFIISSAPGPEAKP